MTNLSQEEIDNLLNGLGDIDSFIAEPSKETPKQSTFFDSLPLQKANKIKSFDLRHYTRKRKDEGKTWTCPHCHSEMKKVTVFMGIPNSSKHAIYCKTCDITRAI